MKPTYLLRLLDGRQALPTELHAQLPFMVHTSKGWVEPGLRSYQEEDALVLVRAGEPVWMALDWVIREVHGHGCTPDRWEGIVQHDAPKLGEIIEVDEGYYVDFETMSTSGQPILNALHQGLAADRVLSAQVRFGLWAQGHIPTIENALAAGKSWEEIGSIINWDPATAQKHWEEVQRGLRHQVAGGRHDEMTIEFDDARPVSLFLNEIMGRPFVSTEPIPTAPIPIRFFDPAFLEE